MPVKTPKSAALARKEDRELRKSHLRFLGKRVEGAGEQLSAYPPRVMLVEADSLTATALSETMREALAGWIEISRVGNLARAAAMARAGRHAACLLLLAEGDSRLLETCAASLDFDGACPVIVLGPCNFHIEMQALAAGAADYLAIEDVAGKDLQCTIRHAAVRHSRAAAARQKIRRLEAEIERTNLLREAGHRLVENASHDFRTPLTVIREFASILAEGLAGEVSAEQLEFLQIIENRVDHLSQIVDAILDASRLECDLVSVHRKQQDVQTVIEHVRPMLERQAAASGAELRLCLPPDLPPVVCDCESVGRVIGNLVGNACKAVGPHGAITVWARSKDRLAGVTIGVTDNGRGIAKDKVDFIFGRFHQLADEGQRAIDGFGLGLHISTELVRLNFGELTVRSEPGKGSTFAFTLPGTDPEALCGHYLDFISTSRQKFHRVSVALGEIAGATADACAEAEQFLGRQIRCYDLLIRLAEGRWLICFASDKVGMARAADRIAQAYDEHGRNRPRGPLPQLNFYTVGTWDFTDDPAHLAKAVRRICAGRLPRRPVSSKRRIAGLGEFA